jgi:4-amino-4-deoxy-L-arabinose transferase-like glycosyltransferase
VPGGGYYHAGLIVQYTVAASAFLFGEDGFAARLPGVLFSLGTVALVYEFASRPFSDNDSRVTLSANSGALYFELVDWHRMW